MRDLSKPTVPSDAIQRRFAEETQARKAAAGPAASLADGEGSPAELREALAAAVEGLAGEIVALSHAVHDNPEVGYEERFAVSAVADLLRAHGIEPEVGVYGMETALRAEFTGAAGNTNSTGNADSAGNANSTGASGSAGNADSPAPAIAILAEYDALPGIGHGCGHNVMAGNSVGAFLALHELERRRPGSVPGRVVLQTTPAEECSTAKEVLAVRGMLDGIDAAVQTHSYSYDLTHQTWLGVRRIRAIFTGVPAHAASQPFMGRNALDAATLALTGFGLLRQQILPMDRLHAIVVDGGDVPNIVPERTEISLLARSKYPETLKDLVARVEDVLRGAALMTGTGLEIVTSETTNEMPVRTNGPLTRAWVRSQRERGRDPLPAGVVTETIAAGTDFGNVSVRIPGIHPLIKVADSDVALHTREMAAAAGAPSGDAAATDGAYGLASVALDYLHDAEFRAAVRRDFEEAGGVIDVEHFWDE